LPFVELKPYVVFGFVRDLEGALLKLKAFIDFSKLPNLIITKEVIDTALGDLIKPQAVDVDIKLLKLSTVCWKSYCG
jgi:chromosomal replication initiation ATPase DnaA